MRHPISSEQLEMLANGELSPASREPIERHLESCAGCRQMLDQIWMARGLVRTALLEDGPEPLAGFAPAVLARIRQSQSQTFSFWYPLERLTQPAIPLLIMLLVISGWLAYANDWLNPPSGGSSSQWASNPYQGWDNEIVRLFAADDAELVASADIEITRK